MHPEYHFDFISTIAQIFNQLDGLLESGRHRCGSTNMISLLGDMVRLGKQKEAIAVYCEWAD